MKLQRIYNSVVLWVALCMLSYVDPALAQPGKYTTANAHSHNDYHHTLPFHSAFNAGFGSIEADVFLKDGRLYVAHDSVDIRHDRTLEALYLEPLQEAVRKNNGFAYADSMKRLLLLIDVKTASEPALEAIITLFNQYKLLIDCPSLKIVITGNRPVSSRWTSFPPWLYFDGRLNEIYTPSSLERVALFSANFRHYADWRGEGIPSKSDRKKIKDAVKKSHVANRQIRFWATPDSPNAWRQLMKLKVDYINTDKIQELAEFFSGL